MLGDMCGFNRLGWLWGIHLSLRDLPTGNRKVFVQWLRANRAVLYADLFDDMRESGAEREHFDS